MRNDKKDNKKRKTDSRNKGGLHSHAKLIHTHDLKNEKFSGNGHDSFLPEINNKQIAYVLFAIIIITIIAYFPALKNGFILWDDPEYVTKSPHIPEINLSKIFGEFYFSNYHPLTLLSYSIEHKFFGFNPFNYHFDNLVLHLLNVVLVFYLIFFLTAKKHFLVATVTSLLFAIHPMHVESVAWVSERKDLLYTLFFLLSLISYIFFLQNAFRKKYLAFSFIFFLFSCFSKGQAVVLSPVLLLVDYYYGRKISLKIFAEKIPFFALSVVFGILAIKAQGSQAAINENYYSGFTSLFFGSYSLLIYIWKSILPIKLSGAYPYPLNPDRSMPSYFYLMPVILSVLFFLSYRFFKGNKNFWFGILFFVTTISVVLKFIPVGDTIVAERYSYLAYVGLFFVFGIFTEKLVCSDKYSKITFGALGIISIVLVSSTFSRTKVWKDSFSFWGDVAAKNSNYWRAHNCLGEEYEKIGKMDKAVESYTNAILKDKWAPPIPYMHLGAVYIDHFKEYDKAIEYYKKVLTFPNKQDQSQIDGRQNLGLAYYRKGDNQNSIIILNEAILLSPNHPKGYFLRGLAFNATGNFEKALSDYSRAISLNLNYVEAYINRGVIYTDKTMQYDLGISDFFNVLRIQPNHQDANINIGICYYKKGESGAALKAYDRALQLFPDVPRIYYLKALVYSQSGDKKSAYQNALKAKELGMNIGEDVLNQWR